ncbi:hypothetical protein V6N11_047180 [Hibiscus sabdariffa]|uniref:Uncharacterized protein n=1 Tax=Hibiscus sabdariffa TaxID=183260 RepID=A0ABR2A5F5_9ROSI
MKLPPDNPVNGEWNKETWKTELLLNTDMVDNLNKPTIMRMGMNKPPPLDVEAAMKLKLLLPLKRIASCFHVISTNNEYSIGEFC